MGPCNEKISSIITLVALIKLLKLLKKILLAELKTKMKGRHLKLFNLILSTNYLW